MNSEDLGGAPSRITAELSADELSALEALSPLFGNRTWDIAQRLRRQTRVAYRLLCKLEARGLVERNERYSYVNDIYWDRTSEGSQVIEGRRDTKDHPNAR